MFNDVLLTNIWKKMKLISVLILSYLFPIFGVLVLYVGKKKKDTTYKKASLVGIGIAFALFFLNYIVFMVQNM